MGLTGGTDSGILDGNIMAGVVINDFGLSFGSSTCAGIGARTDAGTGAGTGSGDGVLCIVVTACAPGVGTAGRAGTDEGGRQCPVGDGTVVR